MLNCVFTHIYMYYYCEYSIIFSIQFNFFINQLRAPKGQHEDCTYNILSSTEVFGQFIFV